MGVDGWGWVCVGGCGWVRGCVRGVRKGVGVVGWVSW